MAASAHNGYMGHMTGLIRTSCALLLLMLLAACPAPQAGATRRDNALTDYGVAIRWSEFVAAYEFVDPALREQQPLSDLERERFKQIKVTGYEVKEKALAADGSITQTVEIRLVNQHTQIERSISDRQVWRWDVQGKQLWLTSGLPDFSAR